MIRRLLLLAMVLAVACGAPPQTAPSTSPSGSALSVDLEHLPSASPSSAPGNPPPANETLAEYARRCQGTQAYGLYFGGKKAGWGTMGFTLEQRGQHPVLVYTEEFHLQISMGGQKNNLHEESETVYALTGDGPILAASKLSDEDGTRTRITVKPRGQQLEITTRAGGRETRRSVKLIHDTLAEAQKFERWLRTAQPDDTFTQWSADWTEDPVEQEDHVTYHAREEILWGGVRTQMNKVTVEHKGGSLEALLQNDGTPWKASVGGLIEMRAEDLTTAKKLDQTVDMLDVTAIKVQRAVSSPDDLEHLVLEVEGLGTFRLPETHRQHAYQKDGKTYWDFRRDYRVKAREPLTKAERAEYLKATPALQKDEVITRLARKIAGQGTPVEQANRLQDWIYKNLEKTYSRNASTARDILENKAGDCTEHARLFTAMARSLGIPAREVGGLVSAAPNPMFAWHAWTEIYDGHQWVSVDPMWNEVYVDATHLKLANGSEDYGWVNVAGSMKMRVVDGPEKGPGGR